MSSVDAIFSRAASDAAAIRRKNEEEAQAFPAKLREAEQREIEECVNEIVKRILERMEATVRQELVLRPNAERILIAKVTNDDPRIQLPKTSEEIRKERDVKTGCESSPWLDITIPHQDLYHRGGTSVVDLVKERLEAEKYSIYTEFKHPLYAANQVYLEIHVNNPNYIEADLEASCVLL